MSGSGDEVDEMHFVVAVIAFETFGKSSGIKQPGRP
jgi:hypothetical protein